MRSKYIYIFLIILSLLIALYFARSTFSLYSAKNTLSLAENNLIKLKAENEEIKKSIKYRNTEQYVINEAREKLNYGFEGESIVIIPKDTSMEPNIVEPSTGYKPPETKPETSVKTETIPKMWWDIFY